MLMKRRSGSALITERWPRPSHRREELTRLRWAEPGKESLLNFTSNLHFATRKRRKRRYVMRH